ncbi:DUF4097 family beta strand repeat-containing protein [Tepidimicrobium xylanilyticum]|uniref:DUF4097 and DUF4098 domain-containing protein YvlB n=1 Tax=Tepidimicrobium xylanilyticum TaxID=1123352 RepID=A0A1H3CFU6_9FIRM|nr:DUF4097 family beta strand repeat-containing protein [Tepidimicrobium xylanilyticum]GMG97997.1 hypothetical protein EN5CB1_28230 [Tepidimicrobium xylanilyticum]SDX53003.1 DUF4097 and DUF4098 domain-containing protein YvlB [Tepidimicrobium xylanilyticum]
MRDEKLMILTMLEEGKITSQEAIKLLEALEETEGFIDYEPIEESEEKIINLEKTKENLEALEKNIKDKIKKVEKIDNLGTDISNKLTNVFSNLFSMGNPLNILGNYKVINTTFEKDISHLTNPNIHIKSINGSINLKSWKKENLLIKITYRHKYNNLTEEDKFYDLYEDDNNIIFEPLYTNNAAMDLDVYLPEKYCEKVNLKTSNGRIQVENLNLGLLYCNTTNASISLKNIKGKSIDLSTKNGRINLIDVYSPTLKAVSTNASIKLEDINSDNITVATKNGQITLSNIVGEDISANTSNSSIKIEDIYGSIVNLNTSNGKIICRNLDNEKIKELKLSTSNSTIDVEMANINKKSYFNLETSFGNISLDIPNLVYKVNKQVNLGMKKIVAHSANFNENEEHFMLNASTSNGSIIIK